MEVPTPNNSELKIKHKNYELLIKFKTTELNIIITNIKSFPKLVYEGSFSLEDLKKNNKFFKMFDNINEIYNDLKTLVNNENSFYIRIRKKFIFCY